MNDGRDTEMPVRKAPSPILVDGGSPDGAARRGPGQSPAFAPGRGRWRRGVIIFVVVLTLELVLAAAWGGWQAVQARDELTAARDHAAEGREAITSMDVVGARRSFEESAELFASGRSRLADPVIGAASLVPPLRDDLRAARALAEGGELVANAALDLIATVDDLPAGLQSLAPSDGRLPVDALAALAPASSSALDKLDRATGLVDRASGDVVPQIADAREEFSGQVREARDLVALAALLSRSLPEFMGVDGPREYLLAAQNPAELRGTGGFLGVYSRVTLDDGAISFSEFIPIKEMTSLPVNTVAAPNADYAARYNRFGGAGFWQAINATPDFPSAATAIEQLWERTRGESLDGVIAVDPFAFRELIELSGPVEVPGFGRVGSDEVVEVVANEAYDWVGEDHEERKRVLGAIAAQALQGALSSGDLDPTAALSSFAEIARGRHLLLHSRHEDVQRAFRELELTGELVDPPGDFLGVIVNSASTSKLDYYMDRTVDYDVALHADGSATATARVTFENHAPTSGLPARVIGSGDPERGLAVGENRSWVSLYCATSCEITQSDAGFVVEEELGHPVASGFVTVASGKEATASATWDVEDAWDPEGQRYRLTFQGQPTIRDTRLNVRVEPPPGWTVDGEGGQSITVEGLPELVFHLDGS